jgi:hypothetical protein
VGVSQICCGLFDHLLIERLGCGDPSICAPVTVVTPPPTFEEAVEIAWELIASGGAIDRSDQFTPEHGRRVEALSLGAKAIVEGEEADLIEQAKTDALSYEALCAGIELSLERGWEISSTLQTWLFAHLRGDQKSLAPKSGQPRNPGRIQIIAIAVYVLVRRGMDATRNEATEKEESACDAVAAATRKLNMVPLKYGSVRKIWFKRNKHHLPTPSRSSEGHELAE